MFDKSPQRKSSSHVQVKGESSKGGSPNRGREKNMRGRGRRKNNFSRNQNDESTQPRCNICKRSSYVEKDCWFRGKPYCYNYKKFGHIQKNYRYQTNEQAHFFEKNEGGQSIFYGY